MNTYYLVPAADYDAMFSKAPKDFDAITSGVVNNPTLDEYAKAAALRDSLNTFLNMSQQNKVPIAIPVISHTTASQAIPLPPPIPQALPRSIMVPAPPISPPPLSVQAEITDDDEDDFEPKRKVIISKSGVKAKITPIKPNVKLLPSGPPSQKKKNAADLNVDNIIPSAEKRNRKKSQEGGWITRFCYDGLCRVL